MSETPETTTSESTPEYSLHYPKFTVNGGVGSVSMFGHSVTEHCNGEEDEDAPPVAIFHFPSIGIGAFIADLLTLTDELDPFTRVMALEMVKSCLAEMTEKDANGSNGAEGFAGGPMVLTGSGLEGLLAAIGIPMPDAPETSPTPSGVNESKNDGTGLYL